MFIELENIFNNEGAKTSFDYDIDLSASSLGPGKPFEKPVRVTGGVGNYTGIVKLAAKALVSMNTQCDRCACRFEKQMVIPVEHILVTQLNDEENDDFLLIEKTHFNLDPLVTEDIFLELPSKILCRDDCEGLCSNCGVNLNNGQCGCRKNDDPRLDALKQLLDK